MDRQEVTEERGNRVFKIYTTDSVLDGLILEVLLRLENAYVEGLKSVSIVRREGEDNNVVLRGFDNKFRVFVSNVTVTK